MLQIKTTNLNSPASSSNLMTESATPLWKFHAPKRITFPEIPHEKPSIFKKAQSPRKIAPANVEVIQLIQQKVNDKVDVFFASDEYQRLLAAWRGDASQFYENNWKTKALSHSERKDSIINLFEEVLEFYQLQFSVVTKETFDSAIAILPISLDNLALNQYLNILLTQIIKFPNTFFAHLGLRIFSFCDIVEVIKSTHKGVYYKKILSGLFEINKLKAFNDIKFYFYKFICYHIAQHSQNFSSDWPTLNPKGFEYSRSAFKLSKGFLNLECMKSQQMDQAQILEKVMIDHDKILAHSDDIICKKAQFIKDQLLVIDPSFPAIKGWK